MLGLFWIWNLAWIWIGMAWDFLEFIAWISWNTDFGLG